MELYGMYFWFSTAELHHEPVPDEIRQKCFRLSWQIADMLREADNLKDLTDILEVIFGSSFPTAKERYTAMRILIDRLGNSVNPRYANAVQKINVANFTNLAKGNKSNAPGETWPHRGTVS